MTAPKIKPCFTCQTDDYIGLYKYEHGWQHVECDKCNYLGPGDGTAIGAIRLHNKEMTEKALQQFSAKDKSK